MAKLNESLERYVFVTRIEKSDLRTESTISQKAVTRYGKSEHFSLRIKIDLHHPPYFNKIILM